MRNTENQHILLRFPENLPLDFIKEDLERFNIDGLKVKPNQYKVQAYALMEWSIPAMIGIFILSSYFGGFLSEAGKEHFHLVKDGLKKLTEKVRKLEVITLTSDGVTDKIDKGYNQSQSVSITFQSKCERDIKLLFDNTIEQSDWNNAIDQVFEMLIDNYKNYPNDKLTKEIKDLKQYKNFEIYILIDKETKQLKFYDDNKLLIESRKLN